MHFIWWVQENDDLKLRLASEAGERTGSRCVFCLGCAGRNGAEAEILRGSLEGLHVRA